MTANRTAHIHNTNALEYARLGIPFFRGALPNVPPPLYKRFTEKAISGSLGVQKRKREDVEQQADWVDDREAKKQRFEEERTAYRKEKGRPIRIDERISYAEPPQYRRGTDTRIDPYYSEPLHDILQVGRGILKKTPPVQLVSYDLSKWLSNAGPAPGAVRLSSIPPPIEDDVLSHFERVGQGAERSLDETAEAGMPTDADGADANERDVARARQVPPGLRDAAASMVPEAVDVAQRPIRYTSLAPGGKKKRVWLMGTQTPDELEEWEVNMMLDPQNEGSLRSTTSDDELEAFLSSPANDKTMMDNVCEWLGMREEPDYTDIWDE